MLVAVIGVGSELRGDDIVGVLVAEALQKSKKAPSRLKAFIGCTAPENITGEVKKFLSTVKDEAAHIILIDAAQMNSKPGTIRLLEAEAIQGTSFSTHVLPLPILISYFQRQINCGISVIGIQPKCTDFGKEPSKEVLKAVPIIAREILYSILKTKSHQNDSRSLS